MGGFPTILELRSFSLLHPVGFCRRIFKTCFVGSQLDAVVPAIPSAEVIPFVLVVWMLTWEDGGASKGHSKKGEGRFSLPPLSFLWLILWLAFAVCFERGLRQGIV